MRQLILHQNPQTTPQKPNQLDDKHSLAFSTYACILVPSIIPELKEKRCSLQTDENGYDFPIQSSSSAVTVESFLDYTSQPQVLTDSPSSEHHISAIRKTRKYKIPSTRCSDQWAKRQTIPRIYSGLHFIPVIN